MTDPTNGGRDCAKGHGYLASNCPKCAREAEVADLSAALDAANLRGAELVLERNAQRTRADQYERILSNPFIGDLLVQNTHLRRTVATLRARLRNRGEDFAKAVSDLAAENIRLAWRTYLEERERWSERANRVALEVNWKVTLEELDCALDRAERAEAALRQADEAIAQAGLALALRTKGGAA